MRPRTHGRTRSAGPDQTTMNMKPFVDVNRLCPLHFQEVSNRRGFGSTRLPIWKELENAGRTVTLLHKMHQSGIRENYRIQLEHAERVLAYLDT